MKQCNACKEWKDESDFYKRSGQPQYLLAECIACMRLRSKNRVVIPADESYVETERLVIQELRAFGIPACPGKALSRKWVDVVAWGCVNIEVKSSTPRDNGDFIFALTPRQKQRGVFADLTVLVCKLAGNCTFHVFESDHDIFYNEDVRKKYVVYASEDRQHRKATRSGRTITHLTTELMQSSRNAWELVEDVRLRHSIALRLVNDPVISV